MAIIIPEIVFLNTLKNTLRYIRKDYKDNQSDPSKSLLYKLLNGNNLQRYKLFNEAVSVLITQEDNPRHLDVNLFFNAKRAAIPTLHITLASDSEKNNALAISEGYREPLFDVTTQTYSQVFNRRFVSKYNIIITSDNSNEVILLFHLLRSVLISLTGHLNMLGLENIRQNGSDIQINQELVPNNIFVRSIGVDFEYDVEAIGLFPKEMFIYDPDVSWSGVIDISS